MITNVLDHDLRQSSGDLFHSQRVGELVIAVVKELRPLHVPRPKQDRIYRGPSLRRIHPKAQDEHLRSDQYKGYLEAMGDGLKHHYAHNRHHPEFFGEDGVDGMSLVDVIEMLAD
jgi:hypothetical protein